MHELKEATPPGAPPIVRLAEIVRVARDTETRLDLEILTRAIRAYTELLRGDSDVEIAAELLDWYDELQAEADRLAAEGSR